MKSLRFNIGLIALLLIFSAAGLNDSVYSQENDEKSYDAAKRDYEKAYNLVLDGDWTKANRAFGEYLKA